MPARVLGQGLYDKKTCTKVSTMKPVDGPNLSDQELQQYAREHIHYELWMFLRLGQYLMEAPQPVGDQDRVIRNAVIESFVIHLRNLIAFLYSVRVQTKDIIAADYFRDADDWYAKRPQISRELRVARERSHKEIIHLTTERISGTPPQKGWPVTALVREIKELMRLFAELASAERVDPAIQRVITEPPPVYSFGESS